MKVTNQGKCTLFETDGDTEVAFKDFGGTRSQYGARSVSLKIMDPDLVDILTQDGWTLRPHKNQQTDEVDYYIFDVAINYNSNIPPQIYQVTKKQRTLLTENTVGCLDQADLCALDLTVNPWESARKDGTPYTKAYAKNIHAVLREDPLNEKYGDIPIAGQDAAPIEVPNHQDPNEDDLPF